MFWPSWVKIGETAVGIINGTLTGTVNMVVHPTSTLLTSTIGGFYYGATGKMSKWKPYKFKDDWTFERISNPEGDNELKDLFRSTTDLQLSIMTGSLEVFGIKGKVFEYSKDPLANQMLDMLAGKGKDRFHDWHFNQGSSSSNNISQPQSPSKYKSSMQMSGFSGSQKLMSMKVGLSAIRVSTLSRSNSGGSQSSRPKYKTQTNVVDGSTNKYNK